MERTRSVTPAHGASRAWVTSIIIMSHEQTQVAKCLWPQAAHIDIPLRHSTVVAPHTGHKLNHDREGGARWILGNRAVRRRLRRSIGESGGEGWGAAEGRGRGRRAVEGGRLAATALAGGVGVGIGGRRRRRRQGWWRGWRRPRCRRRRRCRRRCRRPHRWHRRRHRHRGLEDASRRDRHLPTSKQSRM